MHKPSNLSITALGLIATVAFALPASAQQTKEPKEKKQVTTQAPRILQPGSGEPQGRGLYYGGYYLGDDPDPFIRLQIQRDLGSRFPGGM
jgi:hypothetical protein